MKAYHRRGFIEDEIVRLQDVVQNVLRPCDIVRVGNSENEVYPSDPLRRNVLDNVTPNHRVRKNHPLIIERVNRSIDDTHFLNFAEYSANFYDISNVIGTIEKDHKASRKIPKRILQSKSNDETSNPQSGQYWPQRKSQLR